MPFGCRCWHGVGRGVGGWTERCNPRRPGRVGRDHAPSSHPCGGTGPPGGGRRRRAGDGRGGRPLGAGLLGEQPVGKGGAEGHGFAGRGARRRARGGASRPRPGGWERSWGAAPEQPEPGRAASFRHSAPARLISLGGCHRCPERSVVGSPPVRAPPAGAPLSCLPLPGNCGGAGFGSHRLRVLGAALYPFSSCKVKAVAYPSLQSPSPGSGQIQ